ncbi:MAG: radical SAM protein [Deltaproteobacteria bacterium]|nr:radical SAM protein [Deltaproteobacteria bacterium]
MTPGPRAESPEHVQLSLAAALTLGLKRGRFHRDARLGCLNLLLTYRDGCAGRCTYCGLAGGRGVGEGGRTFIRVGWPTHPLDRVLLRARRAGARLRRVCVSMVTHARAFEDAKVVMGRVRDETGLPVSALIAPTLVRTVWQLRELRESGADCVGVAVDAATEALFARHRGAGVGGPHRWDRYWDVMRKALGVFGSGKVSVHLIVGLGETEREMVETIQRVKDLGAVPHLFAFFPEAGSLLEGRPQPPVDRYRRVQLARHLIAAGGASTGDMTFGEDGRIVDFGVDVAPLLWEGDAFRTSGCPGRDGETSCNRPYGNERPGGTLYNYPFAPEAEDLEAVAQELRGGVCEACRPC